MKTPGAGPGFGLVQRQRLQPPGRHHSSVHIGTGLLRSQRRSAQSLASMIEALRAQPPEPTPVARQTQAEASDVATEIKAAAMMSEARIRPIDSPPHDTKAQIVPAHLVDSMWSFPAPARNRSRKIKQAVERRSPTGNASALTCDRSSGEGLS
jgi:hypothetical protein